MDVEDINLRLMRILKQHGVQVAFPTRTVHLHMESPGGRDHTDNA
jgi:hypothetical protein